MRKNLLIITVAVVAFSFIVAAGCNCKSGSTCCRSADSNTCQKDCSKNCCKPKICSDKQAKSCCTAKPSCVADVNEPCNTAVPEAEPNVQ